MNAPTSSSRSAARVALLYHPKVDASRQLAEALAQRLAANGGSGTVVDAWDEDAVAALISDVSLAVTLGGAGTLVRTARLAAPRGVAVVGVNFGRLGYLAEVAPDDALEVIPRLAESPAPVEERLMLSCRWRRDGQDEVHGAVNDVFVGRGAAARAVRLELCLDAARLGPFAADGIVVASPTGSTAYSLSAGGPVVYPTLEVMLVTPVVAHPKTVPPVVVPADAVVEVGVQTDDEATLSIDGHHHVPLASGDRVTVTAAQARVRFVRVGGRRQAVEALVRRLASP